MKFQKHFSLFLAFFLLVSNIGLAFNVRYCGDEITSVTLQSSFVNATSEKSCCGIVEKKSHCCKNKVFHFQKKSDNVIVKSFSTLFDYHFLQQNHQPIVSSFIPNFKSILATAYGCDANAPPFFKLYHQYIFYEKF